MTASPATIRAAAALGAFGPQTVDGEPVFNEPWEGRAYGLALDLVERQGLTWAMFRERLIAAIADRPGRPYYESWIIALERLATTEALVNDSELVSERCEVAAYRYIEEGVDIEVTPLSHDNAVLRAALGDAVVAEKAAHVELYRTFDDRRPVTWGVRSFDASGVGITDCSLVEADWATLLAGLLSFSDE